MENDENCAVLEITWLRPSLEFEEETYIVFGAEMSVHPHKTKNAIENYKVY